MKRLLLLSISFVWALFSFAQSGSWVVYNSSNSDLPSNKIESLAFDGSDVWAGTYDAGVAGYDGSDWTIYNSGNSDLPIDRVLSVAINGDEKWFGTSWGLAHLNAGGNWMVYHTGDGLPNNYVTALKFEDSDNLLVGTGGGGLARYTISTDDWSDPLLLPGKNVTDVDIDSNGDIWVSTYANGAYYLELDANGDVTNTTNYNSNNSDIPHNRVLSLEVDPNDDVWVGCHWLGAAKYNGSWTIYNTQNSDLPDEKVNSIADDINGHTWFATDNGLADFDGSNWTVYNTGNSNMPHDQVEVIGVNSYGDKWAGTWGGGLAFYDLNFNDDLGVVAISSPESGTGNIGSQDVTVKIFNFGNSAQSNFDVAYEFDGGGAVSENVTGPIASGDTLEFTFSLQVNFSDYGTYSLEAYTELSGDENSANDSYSANITKIPPAPTGHTAIQDNTTIDLDWDAWGGTGSIDIFKIYRDGAEIATVGSGTSEYTDNDDLVGGTTYEYFVTAIKDTYESPHSDTASVDYETSYCDPGFSGPMPRDHYIDSVGFVGIHNYYTGLTGPGTDYYNDYTDTHSTELIRGNTYTLEVYYKQESGADNADEYGIWFDWDGDGNFTGTADSAYTGSLDMTGDSSLVIKTVNVPANAATGQTRMRIMNLAVDGTSVDPCGDYTAGANESSGEAEDYALNILDAPSTTHWDFDGGNPADPTYTIFFEGAILNGEDLHPYDEIAVYDNETLVGTMQLTQVCTSDNWEDNSLVTFFTINETGDGYTPGNEVVFRCWDHSEQQEHTNVDITYDPLSSWTQGIFPSDDGEYSIITADFNQTHFDFLGGDMFEDSWTIYIWEAQIDGVDLEEEDEIAIFDGETMVGAMKLSVDFDDGTTNFELTAYSQLIDGSNGYTPGNPIHYKFWDNSEGEEVIYYNLTTLDILSATYTDEVFPSNDGEISFHDIRSTSEDNIDTQTIPLHTGYQFASTYVEPFDPQDYDQVVSEILGNNTLNFVRNSEGNMLRKVGPNWVNGIGDWNVTEGYLYRMNGADTVKVNGSAVDPTNTDITINEGYQFISYLRNTAQDAEVAFGHDADAGSGTYDDLLDDGTQFIRDSDGNILLKIGGNWVNGIGNANPNEGYLVKRNAIAPTTEYSLSFDGSDDYLNLGDISELNGTDKFTISFWMKDDDNSVLDRIFYKIAGGTDERIALQTAAGRMDIAISDGSENSYASWNDYSTEINSGTWFHVAAVFDGTEGSNTEKLKLFINGDQINSLNFNGTIPSATFDLTGFDAYISYDGDPDDYFEGNVDEVRIWSTARSETQINDYMTADLTGSEAGLAGYWKLDEGSGTTADDETTNGYNGSITGASWSEDNPSFITFQYAANPAPKVLADNNRAEPQHFIFEGGNAADPVYTIFIEPGQNVNTGDEIAAFADGKMVGSTVINSSDKFDNAIAAFSTLNSGKGYKAGEELTLKHWDKQSGAVSTVTYELNDKYEDAYTKATYPEGDGVYSIVKAGIAPDSPEKEAAFNLDVYPNPADNNVHINSSVTIDEVRIMNPIGQTIKHVTVTDKNLTIDLSAMKEGLYLIEVTSGDETTVKKLVVR
ncbi:MAG: T9SS type A sorting domain-containing protein [Bacteroidales bacterium]|nr:T9SS type A sorting domain-containing protein [Bacteroidales bacterium]